jgi:hypothetical protein
VTMPEFTDYEHEGEEMALESWAQALVEYAHGLEQRETRYREVLERIRERGKNTGCSACVLEIDAALTQIKAEAETA